MSVTSSSTASQDVDSKNTSMASVTTSVLAKLEDPRAWHAGGESGTRLGKPADRPAQAMAITLPMAPPPPRGRKPVVQKKVLEEDEYVERLGDIIESDYFPHNARMSRALARIGGSVDGSSTTPGVSGFMGTPSLSVRSTPGGSTPGHGKLESGDGASGGGNVDKETYRKDESRSTGQGGALTKFVASHTSEDNQAFAELQAKDQEAFRRRNFWAYDADDGDNATPANLLLLPDGKVMSRARRQLMDAACADRPKIGDDRPNQCVCDARFRIIAWAMNCPGSQNDRTAFKFSAIDKLLDSLPPGYFIVGDAAYPASDRVLVPYPGKNLPVSQDAYNFYQSQCRMAIEQSFGIMVETWKHRTRNQLMFSPNLATSYDTCKMDPKAIESAGATAGHPLLMGAKESKQPPGLTLTKRQSEASSSTVREEERRDRVTGRSTELRTSADDGSGAASTSAPELHSNEDEDEDGRGHTEKEAKEGDAEGEAQTMPPPPPAPRVGGQPEGHAVKSVHRKRPMTLRSNPKVIQAHATRFTVPKPRPPKRAGWVSPIESPSSSRESVAEMLGTNPEEKKEYSEVPMTPSIVPGVDGDSPQITWGSIDGTPMILDPRATPLPDGSLPGVMGAVDAADVAGAIGSSAGAVGGFRFEVKDLPARDKLAHRLEAEDTRRKRAKQGPGTESGRDSVLRSSRLHTPATPRTPGTGGSRIISSTPGGSRKRASGGAPPSPAQAPLTPAGRSLAAKLAQRRGVDTPFGGALTPGPQKRRSMTSSGRKSPHRGDNTPLPGSTPLGGGRAGATTPMKGREGSRGESKTQSSLTDGLLALK